jgi:hypothetical protein
MSPAGCNCQWQYRASSNVGPGIDKLLHDQGVPVVGSNPQRSETATPGAKDRAERSVGCIDSGTRSNEGSYHCRVPAASCAMQSSLAHTIANVHVGACRSQVRNNTVVSERSC